jgi:hypothetical protein
LFQKCKFAAAYRARRLKAFLIAFVPFVLIINSKTAVEHYFCKHFVAFAASRASSLDLSAAEGRWR